MNTDKLTQVFLRLYRDGVSLSAALQTEGVPRASYYDWRKSHRSLNTQLRVEAQALAAVEVNLERVRAARMREIRQLRIEETLLEDIAPVLKNLLTTAQNASSLEQVAILRELRQWLSAGVLDAHSAAEETKPAIAPSLPDFLAGGQISSVSVESPSGDKITLERKDILDGAISEMPAPQ